MHFGIKTSQQDTNWEDMLAVWTEADDIPIFTSAWNFDHFYPIFSDSTGECLEGWTTLAALAQATKRLRVGCMVTGIVYRHPAVLASMASTLDVISGGRLEFGIGAGWNDEECDAYGVHLGTLTERFDRFAEACEMLKGLLTQELTTFDGRYFTLAEARNNPPGVQKPHPPICIGGQGERRTLPLVARYADHWNCPGPDLDTYRAKHAVLQEACDAIGRPIERDHDLDARPGARRRQSRPGPRARRRLRRSRHRPRHLLPPPTPHPGGAGPLGRSPRPPGRLTNAPGTVHLRPEAPADTLS